MKQHMSFRLCKLVIAWGLKACEVLWQLSCTVVNNRHVNGTYLVL